jgi:hypothetical protein
MKISDAIDAGCNIAPRQAFNAFFGRDFTMGKEACVIGAAALALNRDVLHVADELAGRRAHPKARTLDCVLYTLNDKHKMPREQIAAWLRRIGL